ncbi:unnamed protein product [Heterotrigona itama]|uniref:Uncharacterized protein n=1 Tax=Heterotrigona itama TaxID=395501 RepID=A0A6V7HGL1_9HYME|nr:unnamed protein product [Heterotrigona itama]
MWFGMPFRLGKIGTAASQCYYPLLFPTESQPELASGRFNYCADTQRLHVKLCELNVERSKPRLYIIDPECFVEEARRDETLLDRKRFTAKGKGVKPRIVVWKSPRFQRQLKQPGIADVSVGINGEIPCLCTR